VFGCVSAGANGQSGGQKEAAIGDLGHHGVHCVPVTLSATEDARGLRLSQERSVKAACAGLSKEDVTLTTCFGWLGVKGSGSGILS
jgi:hypothetical protein